MMDPMSLSDYGAIKPPMYWEQNSVQIVAGAGGVQQVLQLIPLNAGFAYILRFEMEVIAFDDIKKSFLLLKNSQISS